MNTCYERRRREDLIAITVLVVIAFTTVALFFI